MFLDPEKLSEAAPATVLDAAARGHLGLDHRFLRALLDRPAESRSALLAFGQRDHAAEIVDLGPDLIALFRYWKAPEGVPFLIEYIREDPEEVPDEVIEGLVEIGEPALEPLLALYRELDVSEGGEAAFVLASLRIRDERIREILSDRTKYDADDARFLLTIYDEGATAPVQDEEPFDIWALYPEHADLPAELLDEEERAELLEHPAASVRAAAASSFFNRELSSEERRKLLDLARRDPSPMVRARAWEALTGAIDEGDVIDAMLGALRNPGVAGEERAGLLVGLAPEADRKEVRDAILKLYQSPEHRAKALEAMWRSLYPGFRDIFAKHLDDPDFETRRAAVWGVGYYRVRSELDRLRQFFDDEDLRSDALFAYALALPGEVSRGRMKGLLARIEKDAHGLAEMEEELIKAALDERLILAGKEPAFQ